MGAHVKHKFKGRFCVDEERIRKVNSILESRLQASGAQATYKVERADAFSYTTSSVEDVVNEENNDYQRITGLTVSADCGEALQLSLEFGESGTELSIDGEDRDFVYLLFSDLRQYLSTEVVRRPRFPKERAPFASMLLFMAGYSIIMLSSGIGRRPLNVPDVQAVLASDDVNAKLGFLIARYLPEPEPIAARVVRFTGAAMAATGIAYLFWNVLGIGLGSATLRYFWPSDVFLIGKQLEPYRKAASLRRNLLWGVGVALLVTVVGGLGVAMLTHG